MTETAQNQQPRIEELFAAGAHFGYSRSMRHPSTKPYIYTTKDRVEIIDLEQTAEQLRAAEAFMRSLGQERKTVLFVGTKNEARHIVEGVARAIGMPYVTNRWVGGTLTNFPEIKKRIQKLTELTEAREKGELEQKYTKKERLLIDREIDDLKQDFGGLSGLEELPDAIFILDVPHEHIATKEARRMGIPVISLSSSDCDIRAIDYPILANDNAVPSIEYVLHALRDAYEAGTQMPTQEASQGTSSKAAAAKE